MGHWVRQLDGQRSVRSVVAIIGVDLQSVFGSIADFRGGTRISFTEMAYKIRFYFVVTALLLLCCIHEGFSIKCWVCRSDSDPKCADPFDNSTVPITDCKQEPFLEHLPGVRPTMCRKIRQKVNGEWRYFRSCAYMGEPGIAGDERFCLMRTGTYNIFMEYCTCNSKDGCNSATYQYGSWLLLIIAFITSVRYSFV